MNALLRVGLVGLWCSAFSAFSAIGSVHGEGVETVPPSSTSQTQHTIEERSGELFKRWKSCAEMVHREGSYSVSDLQSMFLKPQDLLQMLQNLKLAGQGDWLLQSNFYNEETLLKFFNGVKVTWKEAPASDQISNGVLFVEGNVDSYIFPKMTVSVEGRCWVSGKKSPGGRERTLVQTGGLLRIYGAPIPEMTLNMVRSALGPETQNTRDMGLVADGPDIEPTSQGTVVYADKTKWQQAGAEVGTTFAFQLDPPPKQGGDLPKGIVGDDIVVSIVMRQASHRILEK